MADGFGRLFKHYDYKHIQGLHIVHACYAKKCPQDLQGKISVTLINRFQNTIMIVWFYLPYLKLIKNMFKDSFV